MRPGVDNCRPIRALRYLRLPHQDILIKQRHWLSEQHRPKQPSRTPRHEVVAVAREKHDVASRKRRCVVRQTRWRELERVCLSRVRASWSHPCQLAAERPRASVYTAGVCICAPVTTFRRLLILPLGALRSDPAACFGWLLNERHGRTTWRQPSTHTSPCATAGSWDGARQPDSPGLLPRRSTLGRVGVELAQLAETAGTRSRASSPTRRAGNKLECADAVESITL